MKNMNLVRHSKTLAALILAAALAVGGCGSTSLSAGTVNETAVTVQTENTSEASDSTRLETGEAAESEASADTAGSTAQETTGTTTLSASTSDYFTERDLDQSYSASEAVSVDLAKNGQGAGYSVTDGVATITAEGIYVFTGSVADGQIVVEAADTDKVQLVLRDLALTNDDGPAILVLSADKVFVTLEGENTLADGGVEYTQTVADTDLDGVIFAKDDVVIGGDGSLAITASMHGIVAKDDLKITGGNLTITAGDKGISANDSIRVADGIISITAADDGMNTSNTEEGKGYVLILDGEITIDSGDDGIHAATTLDIRGGKVDVTRSKEGLEALDVEISGGEVSIVATDDGINAARDKNATTSTGSDTTANTDAATNSSTAQAEASQSAANGGTAQAMGPAQGGFGFGMAEEVQAEAMIRITGGQIYVNAGGDGLDSNGELHIEGGEIIVEGPTDSANSAIDTGTGNAAVITGGTVAIIGSAGMAESFNSSSTQYNIMVNLAQTESAGSRVSLADADGNLILAFTPTKSYSSVILSSPQIADGEYTVTTGSTETAVTVSSVNTVSGAGGMGGFGFQGGMRDQGQFNGQQPPAMNGEEGTEGSWQGGMPGQGRQDGMGRPGMGQQPPAMNGQEGMPPEPPTMNGEEGTGEQSTTQP